MSAVITFDDGARLSFGGDEFVFVEVDQAMSLETALRVVAITDAFGAISPEGVLDVCPASVSYMIRVDPDRVDPRSLVPLLRGLHTQHGGDASPQIATRIIEMPVLYGDPWTTETLMRFRDRHQTPDRTDLEFVAESNGFASIEEFIAAHSGSPSIVTFIGFVPGNSESFQLVPRERQIQAPKYVRPRTDTPERAVGSGGAFTCIYPVRGGGGFQLIGRTPVPVFDRHQRLHDFADSMALPKTGTLFKFRPIDRDEYDDVRARVEDATYRLNVADVTFDHAAWAADPDVYNARLMGALS